MIQNFNFSQFLKGLALSLVLLWFVQSQTAQAEDWVYNLEPGDTLWKISHKHLRDPKLWDKLRKLNGVQESTVMPVGTKLIIPREWLRETPMGARLEAPTGEVQLAYADGTVEPAVVGDIEDALSVIVTTGVESRVSVILGDGSTLDLGPESRLSFVRMSALGDGTMSDIEVKLESGNTAAFFPSTNPNPGRFLLWTKPAVTSVRGTIFRVAVESGGESARTEVLEGGVDFSATGQSVNVPASFGSKALDGKPPVPPKKLLTRPDLASVPALQRQVPFVIDFGEVDGADAYRVQLARDSSATSIILDQTRDMASLDGIELPDGTYELRVRGIDDLGLEGFEAVKSIRIDQRPATPVPVIKGRFRTNETVRFAWNGVGENNFYTVRLGQEESMNGADIVQADLAGLQAEVTGGMIPGRYFWQVSAKDKSGDESLPSDPVGFDVLLPPQPVALTASEGEDGRLLVSWKEQQDRFIYRVEISKSADFAKVERTFEIDGNADSLPRPLPGTYWVRARAVDDDGFAGEYGEAVEISFGPRPVWAVFSIPAAILALALLL